jgi:hypothetical protein
MASIRARNAAGLALFAFMAVFAALAASWVGGTTRASAEIASDCTPGATRTALASFVSAFNGGDYQQLDGLVAVSPLFQWYSSNMPGLRRTAEAHSRESLIAYFRARHLKHDRLRLVSFTFTANSRGYGNFVFKMRRSAADYRRGAWFGLIGKGAAVCFDQPSEQPVQLIVVSVGGPNWDKR